MKNITVVGLALAAHLALIPSAFGQSGPESHSSSQKGAVLKNKAPVNTEILAVKFPRPQEFTLKNGLQVLILEDHFLPKMDLFLVIPHGSLEDPADMPGLASFTADLLEEGAAGYSSLAISEALDAMGASFSASSNLGSPRTDIYLSGLSEYSDSLIHLFADLVLRPSFPEEELKDYRDLELSALTQARTQSTFLARERMQATLYPGHPAQYNAATPASLNAVTVEHLKKFHSTYYVPNGAILAVTGDVVPKDILPKLEAAFGAWPQGNPPPPSLAAIQQAVSRQVLLVNRPKAVQTSLVVGNVGIKRTDPDYVFLHVLNQVFGSSSSSRLFMKLREEKGYTYGAYSSFDALTYPGPYVATAEVRSEVTSDALTDLLAEIDKIINTPVPSEELEAAKRSIVARFALSLDRSRALTARAVELKLYNLPADYWDQYPAAIVKVTADDVKRVAARYLEPSKLQIVAVADAEKVLELLKKFGPLTQYEMDGTKTPAPAPTAAPK